MTISRPTKVLLIIVITLSAQSSLEAADKNPKTQSASSAGAAPASKASQAEKKLKLAPNQTAIYFKDLHCKHCAKKVARKLFAVKGVVRVQTDLKTDIAIVTPQSKKKLDPVALWKAGQKAGFPVLKLVGPEGSYEPDPKTKGPRRIVRRQSESSRGG